MHQLILQQDGETFIWHFYYQRNPRCICAVTSICLLRVGAMLNTLPSGVIPYKLSRELLLEVLQAIWLREYQVSPPSQPTNQPTNPTPPLPEKKRLHPPMGAAACMHFAKPNTACHSQQWILHSWHECIVYSNIHNGHAVKCDKGGVDKPDCMILHTNRVI